MGVGVDLVSVERLAVSLSRTPSLRDRLFTPAEADLPIESLAARFAAKEALAKALSHRLGAPAGLSWQDAEVVIDEQGRPSLVVRGTVAELVGDAQLHLSLSHDGGFAIAYLVLES